MRISESQLREIIRNELSTSRMISESVTPEKMAEYRRQEKSLKKYLPAAKNISALLPIINTVYFGWTDHEKFFSSLDDAISTLAGNKYALMALVPILDISAGNSSEYHYSNSITIVVVSDGSTTCLSRRSQENSF